ncbi:hypothetical protein GCM10009811_26180 [Nostocoides veronense]|uniref:Uncharacterized protein n=1 Tax=Nostocoides veronense TaxID=330836 RepID=A0ABN2LWJ1_9MICO
MGVHQAVIASTGSGARVDIKRSVQFPIDIAIALHSLDEAIAGVLQIAQGRCCGREPQLRRIALRRLPCHGVRSPFAEQGPQRSAAGPIKSSDVGLFPLDLIVTPGGSWRAPAGTKWRWAGRAFDPLTSWPWVPSSR